MGIIETMEDDTVVIAPPSPLIGTVLLERYEFTEEGMQDNLGTFFLGIDHQTTFRVGICVTQTDEEHRQLQTWLGHAFISRGKDFILAVGHIDPERSFVVFAEAALDYLRPVEDAEEAPEEDEELLPSTKLGQFAINVKTFLLRAARRL
jgi:hypothetical protein